MVLNVLCNFRSLLTILLLLNVAIASADTLFTIRDDNGLINVRDKYNTELLTLALEKTKQKYGGYKIAFKENATDPTLLRGLHDDKNSNFVLELTYRESSELNNLIFVNFPHDLGVLGFRVCLTNQSTKKKMASVESIELLKKFTIAQGQYWFDVPILRQSGFTVEEVANPENIFKMVVAGRVDLYCRGVNEFMQDYKAYAKLTGLTYDEHVSIFYPYPRFFYLNKNNTLARDRIEEGLKLAYQDGSLQKVWAKYYLPGVEAADLKHRKIFRIPNPLIKNLSPAYEQYFFDPLIKPITN